MAESKVNPTADNESSSRSQLHGMRCGYRSEGEGASAPSRCHSATYGYAVRGGGKLPAIGGLAEREVIDWQGLSHHLVIEAMDHEVISTLLQVDWNHHCPP
ncbi:hypothetical protein B296_00037766 [Ensete ventricosum]|uniref:Uncharacterized protein n=1 Tax=Ensete ventricosum TaxID=4639 RepID=A0A426ZYH2_ENSVE|nr:hypothetical protein B296_00037766 [Ensete ventricosum]